MAIDFSEKNAPLVESIRTKNETTGSPRKNSSVNQPDSVNVNNDPTAINEQKELLARLDSLEDIKNMLHEDIVQSQNILSSNWNIAPIIRMSKERHDPKAMHRDSIQVHYTNSGNNLYLTVHKTVDKDVLNSIKVKSNAVNANTVCISTFWYKVSYVFSRDHFWGFCSRRLPFH